MDDCIDESESLVSLSNLTAAAAQHDDGRHFDQGKEKKEQEEKVGEATDTDHEEHGSTGGGIISQLISHLPAVMVPDKEKREEQNGKASATDHKEPGSTADSNGGGIISQLISNLPAVTIPDDLSPEADEASLLIHIIHD